MADFVELLVHALHVAQVVHELPHLCRAATSWWTFTCA